MAPAGSGRCGHRVALPGPEGVWSERSSTASRSSALAGSPEPAVLIHGAFVADVFRPLLAEPAVAERFVLPGATHFLQVEHPRGMAEGLAGFFARHTLPARS
jgi:hypothetical protein